MRKMMLAVVAITPLVGCAGGAVSPVLTADAIACGAALALLGINDPSGIARAAIQTPSCQALTKDVLDSVIASTVKTAPVAASLRIR